MKTEQFPFSGNDLLSVIEGLICNKMLLVDEAKILMQERVIKITLTLKSRKTISILPPEEKKCDKT